MVSIKQKLGWGLASLGISAVLPVTVLEYKKRLAVQEIAKEKLLLSSGFLMNCSGGRCKKLYISLNAPYGDDYRKNLLGTNLEKYLKSCCRYEGESLEVEDAGHSLAARILSHKCIEPLEDAERQWKSEELKKGSFGFISENVEKIELETSQLSKELLNQIPYYLDVAEVALHLTRLYSLNIANVNGGYSLEKFYRHGPNPYSRRIVPNGGIGVDFSYGLPSSLLTPWGKFKIDCPGFDSLKTNEIAKQTLQLEETIPGVGSRGYIGPFCSVRKALNGTALPEIIESRAAPVYSIKKAIDGTEIVESLPVNEEYNEIKTNWKLIRKSVFHELQSRDKGQIVHIESTKEKVIKTIKSFYHSFGIVYGSPFIRILNRLENK